MKLSNAKAIRLSWLVCGLSAIAIFAVRIALVYSHSTDLSGIEQNVIYSTQMFLSGGDLYTSPQVAPFSITQYTPLYYYLCGFSARLLHLDPVNHIHELYIIGRFWSLLFNLAMALIVFRIGQRVFNFSFLVSGIIFCTAFIFNFSHNFAVRSDSMHDFLALVSIYFFLLHYKAKDQQDQPAGSFTFLFPAVLLSVLALLAKQSGIQLIIIYAGFTFLIKDWRSFLYLLLSSTVVYGITLWFCHAKYPFFFENVIGGVSNGISIDNFITYVVGKKLFIISILPLILIAFYIIFKQSLIFRGGLTERCLAIAVLGTFCFATVTALKMGSTIQYYVLFINLAILLVVNDIYNGGVLSRFNYSALAFFSCIIIVVLLYTASDCKMLLTYNRSKAMDAQRSTATELALYIQDQYRQDTSLQGKYIFANLSADFADVSSPFAIPSRQTINNILFKQCLIPQMDILQYSTGPSKVIGYKNIEEMLQNGQVAYIVESQPALNFAIIKNITAIREANYELVQKKKGYLLYKFRKQ